MGDAVIHFVTIGVALERPPTVQQYRRYALYGGTHQDAELVALQMSACTSVMPVEVVRPHPRCHEEGAACTCSGCKVAETEPHGAMGCRCWPRAALDGHCPDFEEESWLIDENCPYHGLSCTCPMVDVSTIESGPRTEYVRGWDRNCTMHSHGPGKYAIPREANVDPGPDRLYPEPDMAATSPGEPAPTTPPTLSGARDSDGETTTGGTIPPMPPSVPEDAIPAILSYGAVGCTRCPWTHRGPGRMAAFAQHITTEHGDRQCRSTSRASRIKRFLRRLVSNRALWED